MDNDIYSQLMGIFTGIFGSFGNTIGNAIIETFKLQFVFTTLGIILIWIWGAKRLKEKDLFEFKNIISLIFFLLYLGFANWVMEQPKDFMETFDLAIKFPSDTLEKSIISAIKTTGKIDGINDKDGIPAMINQTYNMLIQMAKQIFSNFNIFKLQKFILTLLLGIIVTLIEMIYIAILCLMIIITTTQYEIWKSIAIFFLPLMFFSQTRGMVGGYIKILISLTLYKPAILLMAAINFATTQAIMKLMPTSNEAQNGIMEVNLFIMALVGVFSIYLLKCIPKIIDGVIGTQSDMLGQGNISAMASKGAGAITSTIAGAGAGSAMGIMKKAYSQGGGGLKGSASAAVAGLTGGASVGIAPIAKKTSNAISKGISFGASKLSKGGKK
ncbi:hypothetical protein BKH42_08205 [Helicobacter sp. 13S00482-2]|uniref:type IV secretion system protein n=1 Tax=Helicobacter sp. 13S00482-2 TaxID=1476200 RepID=UPI000BA62A89|nr:type IV secretion system protein [Helicobacter sp. 13S00482-2]PAF53027.1 hypothetical protein BKH42_08205 [Helicobacter sp. 13S00482-2]